MLVGIFAAAFSVVDSTGGSGALNHPPRLEPLISKKIVDLCFGYFQRRAARIVTIRRGKRQDWQVGQEGLSPKGPSCLSAPNVNRVTPIDRPMSTHASLHFAQERGRTG